MAHFLILIHITQLIFFQSSYFHHETQILMMSLHPPSAHSLIPNNQILLFLLIQIKVVPIFSLLEFIKLIYAQIRNPHLDSFHLCQQIQVSFHFSDLNDLAEIDDYTPSLIQLELKYMCLVFHLVKILILVEELAEMTKLVMKQVSYRFRRNIFHLVNHQQAI